MNESIKSSNGSHVQELALTRKRILDDLRRIQVIGTEPAQAEKLEERRRLKEQLKIVNTAIKAAGGKLKGPAVITC